MKKFSNVVEKLGDKPLLTNKKDLDVIKGGLVKTTDCPMDCHPPHKTEQMDY